MAKASLHNVDFSNVKDGGNFNTKRIEEGDYLAKVIKVEDSPVKSGDNKGRPQYLFTIKLVDHPASTFPYYCQLSENQLWKLRNIMIAAGMSVPKKRMKVDPNRIVGKLIGVLVEDDEYEGKPRSAVNGVFPAADLGEAVSSEEDAEEDEEEDAPLEEEDVPDTSDEADEDEADDDDEEEGEADRLAGLNRAQLKAEIIKLQSDFQARKSQSDDDLREVLRGLQAAGDVDDEEEEDEEPTPPPAKKKAAAAKKAPAKRKAKPKAEDIDDEELDELDIDNL